MELTSALSKVKDLEKEKQQLEEEISNLKKEKTTLKSNLTCLEKEKDGLLVRNWSIAKNFLYFTIKKYKINKLLN